MAISNFVGRVLLASLFVLGGVDKVLDPSSSVIRMADVGLPLPSQLIYAVIAVELGGGLLVAAGFGRIAQIAALGLVAHTLAVNVLLHPFWAVDPELARTELSFFFKNIAVIGGLLIVASGARVDQAKRRVTSAT